MKLARPDTTNFGQSLMHMIKGNLGTGILAMAKTFSHAGLVNAIIGLPLICLVNTYCVHLLVGSAEHVERKLASAAAVKRAASASATLKQLANCEPPTKACVAGKPSALPALVVEPRKRRSPAAVAKQPHAEPTLRLEYSQLAKVTFKLGPKRLRRFAGFMQAAVKGSLLSSQVGVCCVYLVFVVDNVTEILRSNKVLVSKNTVFLAIYPIALLLSYIRTLRRLAIASACANAIQALGIAIIIEFLARDLRSFDFKSRDMFRPANQVAMAFATAMFAFEGIAIVLPIYARMKRSQQMSAWFGVVNVSYVVLMVLYFLIGFLGYLKFGANSRDSITLDLPPLPLYDCVRAMFAISIFLSYPLQFYVLNDILWSAFRTRFLINKSSSSSPSFKPSHNERANKNKPSLEPPFESSQSVPANGKEKKQDEDEEEEEETEHLRTEYLFRTFLVSSTFLLAASVPKLNFLMDLVGSLSATLLCLILPAAIHIAAFWQDLQGAKRALIVFVDITVIVVGFVGGGLGFTFSVLSFMGSFQQAPHTMHNHNHNHNALAAAVTSHLQSANQLSTNSTASPTTKLGFTL